MVEPGQPAPDFSLESDKGGRVSLAGLRGKPVVLYFYPKDDTSGCTTQASDLRDSWAEFERRGATVLGVSPDSIESHEKFSRKFSLPFPLLADPDHAVAEAYGAWGKKTNYGRTYQGIIRSGFVIAPDGTLAAAKRNVKADRHREWALAELDRLAG
ncbi:MAG TPA: thioredoxin-dependent thiol peroxidase [Gaiellales bacterium]|nr:thioredoxin-dependent thiol peroxidase [Gaiellales bacterium]